MLRSAALLLLVLCLAGIALGCSSDKEKGINSNKDRPKAADWKE